MTDLFSKRPDRQPRHAAPSGRRECDGRHSQPCPIPGW